MICVVTRDATTEIPIILFGAFDRHNFGDLLFPHITTALLPGKNLIYAGLAERDLRCYGGHRVMALRHLAAQWGQRPVNLIHAGGEVLTCDAWEAALMLMPPHQPQEIRKTIARLDTGPQEKLKWARSRLGISGLAPYTLQRELFPCADRVIYNAVGGVDLARIDPAMQAEVLANLNAADAAGVRDRQTQALLAAAGISARLMPDPAVMVAELFGEKIRRHADAAENAQLASAFSQGYVAVQFSADFGDDQTLAELAAQLDQVALSTGYGVAFFRAGAAPWHDDLLCYQRVAARMRAPAVKIFTSLNLWDICALLCSSRGYLGSSLHGRIVATAFARPRLNLSHPLSANRSTKQAAYAATWEPAAIPAMVEARDIAEGLRHALTADPEQLRHSATELVECYRQGFNALLIHR